MAVRVCRIAGFHMLAAMGGTPDLPPESGFCHELAAHVAIVKAGGVGLLLTADVDVCSTHLRELEEHAGFQRSVRLRQA